MTIILNSNISFTRGHPLMVLPAQPRPTIFRITRTVILSAFLFPAFLLFQSHAYSQSPPVVDLTHGLRWTVRIQTEQSGKTSQSHVLTYSATPSALRIDQPDNKGVDLILWRLDLGKVYAVDTRTRTYQVQSIRKILSYQGFSDLIGQHAGSNPGDVHTVGVKTETVAGYTCTPETYRHQFRGTVVGMINGDQKTVVCASSAVNGFSALKSFRENLLAMGGTKMKSGVKSRNPSPAFYLSITRVTHYKTGFIIRILNSIGLYDQSKVPAYQKESSSVLTVSEESFPPSTFSLSPDYRKAIVLPRTGGAP